MENQEQIEDKINTFFEKKEIDMLDREEICLSMFLQYREANNNQGEDLEDDFPEEDNEEDDFPEDEEVMEADNEEDLEEKPKVIDVPKKEEPKQNHNQPRKPSPKKPPSVKFN